MGMDITLLGYIDPNTSQHVFSMLGPLLALLTAAGGVLVTAAALARRRIASCFRNASWAGRVALVSGGIGILGILIVLTWLLLR
jgi:hypothetical protein